MSPRLDSLPLARQRLLPLALGALAALAACADSPELDEAEGYEGYAYSIYNDAVLRTYLHDREQFNVGRLAADPGTGSSFTLTDKNEAYEYFIGQTLAFRDDNGPGGGSYTQRTGGTRRVTAIDTATGQITVDAPIDASLAVGDYVWQLGHSTAVSTASCEMVRTYFDVDPAAATAPSLADLYKLAKLSLFTNRQADCIFSNWSSKPTAGVASYLGCPAELTGQQYYQREVSRATAVMSRESRIATSDGDVGSFRQCASWKVVQDVFSAPADPNRVAFMCAELVADDPNPECVSLHTAGFAYDYTYNGKVAVNVDFLFDSSGTPACGPGTVTLTNPTTSTMTVYSSSASVSCIGGASVGPGASTSCSVTGGPASHTVTMQQGTTMMPVGIRTTCD